MDIVFAIDSDGTVQTHVVRFVDHGERPAPALITCILETAVAAVSVANVDVVLTVDGEASPS